MQPPRTANRTGGKRDGWGPVTNLAGRSGERLLVRRVRRRVASGRPQYTYLYRWDFWESPSRRRFPGVRCVRRLVVNGPINRYYEDYREKMLPVSLYGN